jgi:hypothetical protein
VTASISQTAVLYDVHDQAHEAENHRGNTNPLQPVHRLPHSVRSIAPEVRHKNPIANNSGWN